MLPERQASGRHALPYQIVQDQTAVRVCVIKRDQCRLTIAGRPRDVRYDVTTGIARRSWSMFETRGGCSLGVRDSRHGLLVDTWSAAQLTSVSMARGDYAMSAHC